MRDAHVWFSRKQISHVAATISSLGLREVESGNHVARADYLFTTNGMCLQHAKSLR